MSRRKLSEHARVTAICVNLALDGVEEDILAEIERSGPDAAHKLSKVLQQLRERRISGDPIKSVGRS